MQQITLEAAIDNLSKAIDFIDGCLEGMDCPLKKQMQVDVAVEELFVNVAHYAYPGTKGDVTITFETESGPARALITLTDSGIPFNPLEREDPDITLKAEERGVGGLGIFMVKKSVDAIEYRYSGGKNILRITKNI